MQNVEEVLLVSDYLVLPGIKDHCKDILKANIDMQHFLHIKYLADRFDLEEVNELCVDHMRPMMEGILRDRKLLQYPCGFLLQILSNEKLTYVQEKAMYEMVIRWVKYKPDREKYLARLFDCLDMEKMPIEYVENKVMNEQLVKKYVPEEKLMSRLLLDSDNGEDKIDVIIVSGIEALEEMGRCIGYQIEQDRWFELPGPRYDFNVRFNHFTIHKDRPYLLQGVTTNAQTFPFHSVSCSFWKLENASWHMLPAPVFGSGWNACELFSCADDIYVFSENLVRNIIALRRFSTQTNKWHSLNEHPCLLSMVGDFAVVSQYPHIYVLHYKWLFGVDHIKLVWYDIMKDLWTELPSFSGPQVPENFLFSRFVCTLEDSKIMVSSEVGVPCLVFDFDCKQWSLENPLEFTPECYPRKVLQDYTFAAVELGDSVYILKECEEPLLDEELETHLLFVYKKESQKYKALTPPPLHFNRHLVRACHMQISKRELMHYKYFPVEDGYDPFPSDVIK